MKRTSSRKGSALLIVLGMLAFMVVSAVGFSVFMRESRKPSSHLKRSITARFLLRAALANAIARVDGDFNDDEGRVEGIYDDLYPGVGPSQSEPASENGDYWGNHVFMPFGQVDPMYTVSTLTLESLAYLPPAIINEVRVWSRRTRTAEWRNLAYDLGRYAFCAVDVSDCFDINKVRANERRTSAANHRFNLSPLYPENGAALDEVLDKVLDLDPPSFISLADYNIVAGTGTRFAPWMHDFIGTAGKQIYERTDDEHFVSNALFITDTWFPPTNTVGGASGVNVVNLEAGGRNQPWTTFEARSALEPLDACVPNTWADALYRMLQGVGIACLYDYLDEDQVPLSYCLPCTETAPMVCALGIDSPAVTVAFRKEENFASGDYGPLVAIPGKMGKEPRYSVAVKRCVLEVNVTGLKASGVLAFPFKRAQLKKDSYETKFSGEALFRVFFGPKDLKSRVHSGQGEEYIHPLSNRAWANEPVGWKNGVYTARAAESDVKGELNFSKKIVGQEDALGDFDISPSCRDGKAEFTLFYHVEMLDKVGGGTESWYCFDGLGGDPDAFQPRSLNGRLGEDPEDNASKTWSEYLKKAKADKPSSGNYTDDTLPSGRGTQRTLGNIADMYPHVAVWVRLFNDDDTYDVVPARGRDDIVYGHRVTIPLRDFEEAFGDKDGGQDVAPILEFRDGRAVALNGDDVITRLESAFPAAGARITFDAEWNRLYAADPRYNFAPENWFAVKADNGRATKKQWLDAITPLLGDDGRDRDIFMFTSDQEYLQSIEELAFLPRVGDAAMPPGQILRYYLAKSDPFEGASFGDRIASNAKDALDDLAQGELFWRTYSTYADGGKVDDVHVLRAGAVQYEIVSGVNDFRANPFSRDPRIIAAVVEDTPFDYFAASTNELNTLYSEPDKATPDKAKDYVFTGTRKGSAGYIDGFSRLAGAMQSEFARAALNAKPSAPKTMDWREIFDNDLKWASARKGDAQTDIFGVNLGEPLHGVDRKFLHAFWRECFQNRQQLFLLFLRAEPLTVGGMGFGSLAAAQLGARGVALVWRDPEPPGRNRSARANRSAIGRPKQWQSLMEASGPHRTRVLFYHPID